MIRIKTYLVLILISAVMATACSTGTINGSVPHETYIPTAPSTIPVVPSPIIVGDSYVDWRTAYEIAHYTAYNNSGVDIDYAETESISYLRSLQVWGFGFTFSGDKDGLSIEMVISSIDGTCVNYEQKALQSPTECHTPITAFRTADIIEKANEYALINYGIAPNTCYIYIERSPYDSLIKVYYDAYSPDIYTTKAAYVVKYYDGVMLQYDMNNGVLLYEERYQHSRNDRVIEYLSNSNHSYLNIILDALKESDMGQNNGQFSMTYDEFCSVVDDMLTHDLTNNLMIAFSAEDTPCEVNIDIENDLFTIMLIYNATIYDDCDRLCIVCTNDVEYKKGEFLFAHNGYYWYAIGT